MRFSTVLTALLTALLLACSGGTEQAGADTDDAGKTDHVWKEQVETIDRAKGVEDTLKEADQTKREAIKDSGGG